MSWLRPQSFARQLSRSLDPRHDYEPQACYSSFCKHWQQAHEIILKSQPRQLHDDVLAVANHLEQLATLLELEARAREVNAMATAACLEHLLTENLLDKLFEWSNSTGMYKNAVRSEELKLFGCLIIHYSTQVLAAEPFLRPLLKLFSGLRNEIIPLDQETQLVMVLNHLCVSLMQHIEFIDLFFLTNHTQTEAKPEFIIARLLLKFVHREGGKGSAARDALLLCANMSARCPQLARCMLEGDTCPVLATGLSGLYSLLPRTLADNVCRLTADDVNQAHKLTLFTDSLEFCNAVAQVAHPSIKKQLLDLLYQGFLVPVMGPALLQSGAPEQAAAMAYLELVLRCSTQRGLLRAVLHFLFTYEYDGVRLIDVMLRRLDGNTQLSLVSLSLMETLIDLNCEDVMLELVYKHLLKGHHLLTHRYTPPDPDSYRDAAVSLLSLSPQCCFRPLMKTRAWVDELATSGRRVLDLKRDEERVNGVQDGIAMNSLVQEVRSNYGNPNDTLFGNYHAYLCDARFEIVSRSLACAHWSAKYDSIAPPRREPNNNTKETRDDPLPTKEQDSLISNCTSGYDTLKTSDTSEKEPHSLTSLTDEQQDQNGDGKDGDSLISTGSDSDKNEEFVEDSFTMCFLKVERGYEDAPVMKNWVAGGRVSTASLIGPLLASLLKKTAALLESDVLSNCLVTALVSKLCAAPGALLPGLLLPQQHTQPNVPSLYQILSKLKEELDELTSGLDNTAELVDKARVFLVQRELLLVKRAPGAEEGPNNVTSIPLAEPLRRGENKRRSISSSLSNMFGRRLSGHSVSPSQPHSIQHTPTPAKRPVFTQEAYWNQSIALRSILNAVLLDEWLKELAALCEEHALRLSAINYEDDIYLRTVGL